MIKGITIVRPAGTPEAYAKLASFFSALGFEAGRGWEEELSRGVSFLAPLGNLEFADGIEPSTAEIMVEVTGLEAVQTVAREWMIRSWGEQEVARRLSASTLPVTRTGRCPTLSPPTWRAPARARTRGVSSSFCSRAQDSSTCASSALPHRMTVVCPARWRKRSGSIGSSGWWQARVIALRDAVGTRPDASS